METAAWFKCYTDQKGFDRIENSIAAAEERTSGEIVPVVVRQTLSFHHVTLLLALSLAILYFPFHYLMVHFNLLTDLSDKQLQLLWFAIALTLFTLLRRRHRILRFFTPGAELTRMVEQRALLEFYQSSIKATRDRTGILIFVSLVEHRAVVLADEAIAKHFPADTWQSVVQLLLDGIKKGDLAAGFERAIGRCGEILAQHFPRQSDDTDELANHLIVKEW